LKHVNEQRTWNLTISKSQNESQTAFTDARKQIQQTQIFWHNTCVVHQTSPTRLKTKNGDYDAHFVLADTLIKLPYKLDLISNISISKPSQTEKLLPHVN
jgi:hypothetical protein